MTDVSHNRDEPLGYLLTWTTYGTWLPGDERGWHSKDLPGDLHPDPQIREQAESCLTERPFTLSHEQRVVVDDTIRRHCVIRNWPLHAVAVRSNHVHVVVTAPGYHPDTGVEQYKAWCTRMLKPLVPRREHFWTVRASRRWLNHEASFDAAISYVLDAQDRKGRDGE